MGPESKHEIVKDRKEGGWEQLQKQCELCRRTSYPEEALIDHFPGKSLKKTKTVTTD